MTTDSEAIETGRLGLAETEEQVAAVIDVEFVHPYGDPTGKLWLWEGQAANLITLELGEGRCSVERCEMKNGITFEELRNRFEQVRSEPGAGNRMLKERYHRDYPTGMVEFQSRRFPVPAVQQAAGAREMWKGDDGGDLHMNGEIAEVVCQLTGGQKVQITEVTGTNGLPKQAFWARLAADLHGQPAGDQATGGQPDGSQSGG